MRHFPIFFSGLLMGCMVPALVNAQYQPVTSYPPERHILRVPPTVPAQEDPDTMEASPASPQMVTEPDAPDEGDMEVPKTRPSAYEPQPFQPPQQNMPQSQPQLQQGVPAAASAPVPPFTPSIPVPAPGETDFSSVMLRGLNKVTARAETIEVPIGSSVRFGTIEIVAHRCWRAAPEDSPENAALLEISEVKQDEPPAKIFLGWMFSSSPALSALEHPFYDVTVIACKKEEAGKNPQPAAPVKKKTPRPSPVKTTIQ